MNKKLALLLAVIFIGTTALPAAKKSEPKKEKMHKVREYKLSVKNKIMNSEAKVTLTDTTGKTHELMVPGKKTESVPTDKMVKIQKVEVAIVGGGETTAEIKTPVKKVRIVGTKEAPKVEEAKKMHKKCKECKKGEKCDKCKTCKKGMMCKTCKTKPCKCKKDKVAKKEKKAEKKAKKEEMKK